MGLIKTFILLVLVCCSHSVLTQETLTYTVPPSTFIDLSFSQEIYAPGDTAYVAIGYYNGDMTTVTGINYITIVVEDGKGERVFLTKIRAVDGVGNGYIVFSEKSEPGIYSVIAHSNISSSRVTTKTIPLVRNNNVYPEISFSVFPEGGNWVNNQKNSIGIHSVRPNSVIFLSNQDSIILETKTNKFGWGRVSFLVETGSQYYISYKDEEAKTLLNIQEGSGFAVSIDGLKEDVAHLSVSAVAKTNVEKGRLFIFNNNKVLFQFPFDYKTGNAMIRSIPKSILSEGLHELYVFGNEEIPLSYRAFYLPSKNSITANINLPKTTFQTNEEVEMAISIKGELGDSVAGNASISIINKSALGDELLITGPNHYGALDVMKSGSTEAINNYLLAQQTNEYTEDLTCNLQACRFLKSGRAIIKSTGEPLPEGSKLLFYFHKSQQLALMKIEFGAEFGFENVSNVHGSDGIFYVAEDFYGFEIDDVFIDWYPDRTLETISNIPVDLTESGSEYASFSRNRNLINQTFSVFNNREEYGEKAISSIDRFESRYIEADKKFDMSKFKTFPTMKETITEIIRPLDVVRYNKTDIIRINNLKAATPASTPVYVIDGVMTKNTDYFLSLDPADLKEVCVFKDRVRLKKFGFLGRNGLIWVSTKTGNGAPPVLDKNMIVAPQAPIDLNTSIKNSSDPLFKSTIHWGPNVAIKANGMATVKFMTTDDIGSYLIKVTGVSNDGRYFSSRTTIDVELGKEKQ